ncbi:MAG TPA: RCC1 domain-containing protein [Polyangiales bacterium]|nr:RCC1 domain-containing protein [Polyangiales bacterium]
MHDDGEGLQVAGWPAYRTHRFWELAVDLYAYSLIEIAAGSYQIQALAVLEPLPVEAREAEVLAALQTLRVPFAANPAETARELAELAELAELQRRAPPELVPARAKRLLPGPRTVPLAGIQGVQLSVPPGWGYEDDPRAVHTTALKRAEGRATIRIQVSNRVGHAQALEAVRTFEAATLYRGEFVELSGWPAYREMCEGVRIAEGHKIVCRVERRPGVLRVYDYEVVAAAGDHYIHISATIYAWTPTSPWNEMLEIVSSLRFPSTADVSRTASELDALRQATPRVAPPNAASPHPPPVGPALVAANDRHVYERDERGRLFERTSDPTTSSVRSYLEKGLVALSAGGTCAYGIRQDGTLTNAAGFRRSDFVPGHFVELAVSSEHRVDNGWCGTGLPQPQCIWCARDEHGVVICGGRSEYQTAMRPPDGHFHGLVAGRNSMCALDEASQAVCWQPGRNDALQVPPMGSFTQLTLGGAQTCGLRADGSVLCWQTRVALDPKRCPIAAECGISSPSGSFKQISSGDRHNCGITSADELECWGDSRDDLLNAPTGHFVRVVSANRYSCAMRTDGQVLCWGALGDDGT